MIFLIILGIILLVIAVLLFSPVNISISFKEDFAVKVKFLGIKLFDSLSDKGEKKIEEKKKEEQNKSSGETVKKAKSVFSKLKDKYGFSMAIKELISLIILSSFFLLFIYPVKPHMLFTYIYYFHF